MNTVQISYELTRNELSKGGRLLVSTVLKHKTLMLVFGSVLLALGILIFSYPRPSRFLAAAPAAGAGLCMLGVPILLSWLYGSYGPSKNPYLGQLAKWSISDDRLDCNVGSVHFGFGWDRVLKVVESNQGYLVFTNPMVAHWIPRHAFVGPAELAIWVSIIARRQIALIQAKEQRSLTMRLSER